MLVACTPLNLTVPCELPKLVPVIVTELVTGPELGEMPLMVGAGVTVKGDPVLACPPTVTTTEPVVAPAGTGAVILVELQAVGVAAVPLNLTVLFP